MERGRGRERSTTVWVEDGQGGRARVWPPPSEAALNEDVQQDAARGLALLSRASMIAREDAASRDVEAQAARRVARSQQQGGAQRQTRRDEREQGRRAHGPPPMEREAWRQWTEEVGCVRAPEQPPVVPGGAACVALGRHATAGWQCSAVFWSFGVARAHAACRRPIVASQD
jgi:hypothetical protein